MARSGELICYDRVLLFGTLPKLCCAEGMTSYMYERKVRIFDYPKFAEPFRNQLHENAETLAKENWIEIEFERKRNVGREDLANTAIAKAWRAPRIGLYPFGHGALFELPTVAQQEYVG